MKQQKNAVHPLDVFKPKWTVSRQSIYIDSLIVEHDILIPDSIEYYLTHHFLLLQLSRDSEQVTHIGKQKHEGLLEIGEFFLHPANHSGSYSWNSTDEAIFFIIEPEFLTRTAAQTECLNPDKIELNPIILGRDPQIEQLARSFLYEMQNSGLGGRLYSETLATQLAIHLLRHYCTFPAQLRHYEGGLSNTQLQTIIDYVEASLEKSISLQTLANITNINSTHYFCRLFKLSTGISPYKYVIQQRVAKAKRLLKQKDLPLVEIAMICGFTDQSALTRTFNQCVGTTPSKYRQGL